MIAIQAKALHDDYIYNTRQLNLYITGHNKLRGFKGINSCQKRPKELWRW